MDIKIGTTPIAYKGNDQRKSDRPTLGKVLSEHADGMALGGGASMATFTTINQSTKVVNGTMKVLQNAKGVKAANYENLIKVLGRIAPKLAKNPWITKVAGGCATVMAIPTVVGSIASIANACGYIENPNNAA